MAQLRFADDAIALRLAVAGHPAALIVRSDGQVGELGARGTLLGVFPEPVIEEVATTLTAGDALMLYTDGLTEAHAPRRIVTVPELIERLHRVPPKGAQDAIDALLGLIDLERRIADDIAILSVRVAGVPAPLPTLRVESRKVSAPQ